MQVIGQACSGVCGVCKLLDRPVVECSVQVIGQACSGVRGVCWLLSRLVVECVECASYWAGP